jgi:hypothetical protein
MRLHHSSLRALQRQRFAKVAQMVVVGASLDHHQPQLSLHSPQTEQKPRIVQRNIFQASCLAIR